MKTYKKLLCASLLFVSSATFCVKDTTMYSALGRWIVKSNFIKKLQIKSAILKLKDIEWSKVVKYIAKAYMGK